MEIKTSNNIYHLTVVAHSTRYGKLIELDSNYTNVYSTLEKAVEAGTKWLRNKIQRLYEESNYCTREKDSLTIQDMLNDNEIYYNFSVTEFNPSYADNFEVPEHEYECNYYAPSHIEYFYNIKGELQYYELQYRHHNQHSGHYFTKFPTDDENKPNKFKIGDYVKLKGIKELEDNIFVVWKTPKRHNEKEYFETRYVIATTNKGRFNYYDDFFENQLEMYEGDILKDSPLNLLRKIFTSKIKVSDETMEKIKLGKIVLNENPSWRDLEELNFVKKKVKY